MSLNLKLYVKLVNQVPGIQMRYHRYRDQLTGVQRCKAWAYLISLNVRYYLFKDSTLADMVITNSDEAKKLPAGSESERSVLESPEALADNLLKYDVISFDVFDTLILRWFSKPTDVFFLVADQLNYLDFPRIRQEIEYLAREKKEKVCGNREVTFEEIWSLMEEETGIPINVGMRAEWEAELKSCYANPYFMKVIRILSEHHKKIVITSDMYLRKDQIMELLKKAGYPRFSEYFVSCEYGCSKGDGGLYQILKKRYGDAKIVHIGDNDYSDQKKAKEEQIYSIPYRNVNFTGNAYRSENMSAITGSLYRGIVNAHLHSGLHSYSMTYEYGFVYGGLFVYGYCNFIHQYVLQHRPDKLLFLARDGDILRKVYITMYPEDADSCAYVLWSRMAATKMTADYFKYDYFRRFLMHKVNQSYTLKQIFHSMELDDMLTGYLKFAKKQGIQNGENTLFTEKEAERVKKYLKQHWSIVLAHYREQIENGKQYYKEILKGCRSAVAIDVGWAGSGAVALDYMVNDVWDMNCRITGIIAGTNSANNAEPDSSEAQLMSGKLISYLYSQTDNRDIWKQHNPAAGHNIIVELLLASKKPSFRGFQNKKSGYAFSEKKNEINVSDVQKGIFDFIQIVQEKCGIEFKVSGRDSMAPILLLYHNTSWLKQVINEEEFQMNLD